MGITEIQAGSSSPKTLKAAAAITLRPATLADGPRISSLLTHVFATNFGFSLPPADLAAYLSTSLSTAAILSDIQAPHTDIIVAVSPAAHSNTPSAPADADANLDHIIGIVQLTRGTTDPCISLASHPIELQRLYVAQESHGTGVGRALVEHVEGLAREKGYRTMWLGVWEENAKAQRLYGRLGFGKVGEHDFVMGGCVQRDWIMRKSL